MERGDKVTRETEMEEAGAYAEWLIAQDPERLDADRRARRAWLLEQKERGIEGWPEIVAHSIEEFEQFVAATPGMRGYVAYRERFARFLPGPLLTWFWYVICLAPIAAMVLGGLFFIVYREEVKAWLWTWLLQYIP